MRFGWSWFVLGALATTAIRIALAASSRNDPAPVEEVTEATATESSSATPRTPANPAVAFQRLRENAKKGRFSATELTEEYLVHAEQLPLETLRSWTMATPPNPGKADALAHRVLLHAWAEFDPGAALDHVLKLGWQEDAFHEFSRFAMPLWTRQDPEAAATWLKQHLGEGRDLTGKFLLFAYVMGLAASDPMAAIQHIHDHKIEYFVWSREERLFRKTEHWKALLEGGKHDRFARLWMKSDPAACLEWMDELEEQRRFRIEEQLVSDCLRRTPDPKAEAHRLWRQSRGVSGGWAISSKIMAELTALDPQLAGHWLSEIAGDLDPTNLDALKQQFADDIYRSDPMSAFAWLVEIRNPEYREIPAARIFKSWAQFEPETAEKAFLEAGWSREWIANRYAEGVYELR